MRFWFSGPRILGGLIRPGVSFALSELQSKRKGKLKASDVSAVIIMERLDGAFKLADGSSDESFPDGITPTATALVFTNPSAAKRVLAGAHRRLARHLQSDGWLTDLSAGQTLAALKQKLPPSSSRPVFA